MVTFRLKQKSIKCFLEKLRNRVEHTQKNDASEGISTTFVDVKWLLPPKCMCACACNVLKLPSVLHTI